MAGFNGYTKPTLWGLFSMRIAVLTNSELQIRNYFYSSFKTASKRNSAKVLLVGSGVMSNGDTMPVPSNWSIVDQPQLNREQYHWVRKVAFARDLHLMDLGWYDFDVFRRTISYQFKLHLRSMAALGSYIAKILVRNLSLIDRIDQTLNRLPKLQNLRQWFASLSPDVTVITNPYSAYQTLISHFCELEGVPYLIVPHSFDNIWFRGPFFCPFKKVLVWGSRMKMSFLHSHPNTLNSKIVSVGYPGFDMHRDASFFLSREDFCRNHGLDPSRPFWVYTGETELTVPHQEEALRLTAATLKASSKTRHVQLVVRRHPHDRNSELEKTAREVGAVVQRPWEVCSRRLPGGRNVAVGVGVPCKEEIIDHVNLFKHASAVMAFGSTTILDAAIHDVPILQPRSVAKDSGKLCNRIVRNIHNRPHLRGISEHEAVTAIESWQKAEDAFLEVVEHPEQRHENRKRALATECSAVDGLCGSRIFSQAKVLIDKRTSTP